MIIENIQTGKIQRLYWLKEQTTRVVPQDYASVESAGVCQVETIVGKTIGMMTT
jgi:hypothetical protein